jgi:hypothetical protein
MNDLEKLLRSVKEEVEKHETKIAPQAQSAQPQRLRILQESDALEFLQKLKPGSPDAKWFERFATHYPSRQEAAIAYLESLREVDL